MPAFNKGLEIGANSTSSTIGVNQSWTGVGFDVSQFASVILALKTDTSGTAYMEFSPDGSNWDSSLSYTVTPNTNEVHRLSVTRRYYRAKYTNGTSAQSYFRLQSLVGDQNLLTSNLNSTIQTDADAVVTRGILMGQTDGGAYINTPVTAEGHLEVAIHSPRNPFGSIHVENLYPIFQVDAVYGTNEQLVRSTTGLGGTLTESDSQFVLQTNTTVGGNSTIQSKKRLRYRPGQGCVSRFTAIFTPGVASSAQVAGVGHAEDGLYFGYSGNNFGVLHSYAGIREIRTLTLSGNPSVAGSIDIILNNARHTFPITNSSNGYRAAYEISTGFYSGWSAEPIGSGVVFLSNSVGDKTSSFLLSGNSTNLSGSFTKIRSGQAITENWYPQSSWNIDKMNGSGNSAVILDPSKGNVYQIQYQYLGYGAIIYQIEHAPEGNNPDFVSVHSVSYPNMNTVPSFRNPSFPFTASAYSLGSTTNLSVKTASFAGFIEGDRKLNGPQFTYTETSSAVTTTYKAVFTIKNEYVFKNKTNQCVIHVLSISAAVKLTSNTTTIYIIKNGVLSGNPNFQDYSTNSCSSYDNSATTVAFSNNDQLLFSFSLSETGQESFDLTVYGIDIQPGESITIAAKTSSGTATFFSASVNTREDQ